MLIIKSVSLSDEDKLMLNDGQEWQRKNLLSGVMYRVRVSALNSCGRSKFSDHCSYKTIVPGFPGAPSTIKG